MDSSSASGEGALVRGWHVVVVLGATVLAVQAPLALVFDAHAELTFRVLYVVVTLVMLLDVPITIASVRRTPRGVAGVDAELDARVDAFRRSVARAYAKRWLAVDVVAAVPFLLLFGVPALELIRLVKLFKVGQHMRQWRLRELRYANQLLLLFLVFWMGLVAHWITCGWIALSGTAGDPAGRTIVYITAFYWTVVTLATVGYGDITPVTPAERLYAIGTIVLGLGFFGYIIGLIARIWARRDPARTRFEDGVEQLSMAVKYGHLPRNLQRRIYEYYYYMWRQRLGYNEADFLRELPRNLRAEVSLYLKRDLLTNCALFIDAEPTFVRDIAVHLHPVVLTPSDTVFHAGEPGDEMYFIARGIVEVLDAEGMRLAVHGPGDFFGEIALLRDVPRTATVRALTYCDVYMLSRRAYETVVVRYPRAMRRLEAEAQARQPRPA